MGEAGGANSEFNEFSSILLNGMPSQKAAVIYDISENYEKQLDRRDIFLNTLAVLASDHDSEVREAFVKLNKSIKIDLIDYICQNYERQTDLRDVFLKALGRLLQDDEGRVRSVAAMHSSLPADMQRILCSYEAQVLGIYATRVLISLAQNTALIPAVQEQLLGKSFEYRNIHSYLLRNPALTLELQEMVFLEGDHLMRLDLGRNPSLIAKLRQQYLRHEDWRMRNALASNPSLSDDMKSSLMRDESPHVRSAIALHQTLSREMQDKLSLDPDYNVRADLALNGNLTSVKAKKSLARDSLMVVCEES
ncbi:MAG: hypothetical protein GC137_09355 [Alphaproteobacteria bacterium]|nr:hypothetical protein [Alphaproteobacteria bacterium]